jgi:hypothetical protein
MKITQVIQAAIPGATMEQCDYILWERTPFPAGDITARLLYRAASSFRRAIEHKIMLCSFCHNKVFGDESECFKCTEALSNLRSLI